MLISKCLTELAVLTDTTQVDNHVDNHVEKHVEKHVLHVLQIAEKN